MSKKQKTSLLKARTFLCCAALILALFLPGTAPVVSHAEEHVHTAECYPGAAVHVHEGNREEGVYYNADGTKAEPACPESHECSLECYERLHKHTENLDETVYMYTCDSTETYTEVWYNTDITKAEMEAAGWDCGHKGYYYETCYYCEACGEYLYMTRYYGCKTSSCRNYYNNSANPHYKKESHPGSHSYGHAGTRYTCTNSTSHNEIKWEMGSGDLCENRCSVCGELLYYYSTGYDTVSMEYGFYTKNTYKSGEVPAYHYYYVKEPLEGGCYSFGEAHADTNPYNYTTTRTEEECYEHGSYDDVYRDYNCDVCGLALFYRDSIDCSGCGYRETDESYYRFIHNGTYEGFSYVHPVGEWIGDPYYYNISDRYTLNKAAMHRTQTLTCTEIEYGEKICDKVVVSLIPEEAEQIIISADEINTAATAVFMNNVRTTVECAYSGFDAAKYNEWQTVTLSYGEYSAADSKAPQTATIQVYLECVDFDVTTVLEDSTHGTVSGGGTYTAGTSVTVGASASTGYEFEGWYEGEEKVSPEESYTFAMPARNVDLTAKFTPKTYLLHVYSESPSQGEVAEITSAPYKSEVTVEAYPAEGFVFEGWYDAENELQSEDAVYTFEMPAYDYTLRARFGLKKYTVSFDTNGGEPCDSIKAAYLGIYGDLPVPVKDGYTFLDWQYNGSTVRGSDTVMVKGDHTLTALWIKNIPEFIMVNFGAEYQDNSYGELPTPSKTGYSFINWYLTENALGNGDDLGDENNTVYPDTIMKIPYNHTIHAGWKEQTFTLSFESFGGSACASMPITYDRAYGYHRTLPVPTKEGYTFAGWWSSAVDGNGVGTLIEDKIRVQVSADKTIYAKWTQDKVKVIVTFNPRTREQVGLTAAESKVQGYGSTIGILSGEKTREVTYPGTYGTDFPTPVRTGYSFTGWKYEDTVLTENMETLAAFNHTFYATYEPKQYTITLDDRSATSTNHTTSVSMTFDALGPDITVPTKTGYTFVGYYTGTRGTGIQYYDASGHCVKTWTEDNVTVLYALWKQNGVDLPETGDRTEPDPLPEVDEEGNIGCSDAIGLLYADDYNPSTGALSDLQPYLTYDTPGGEGAIPGTEKVSFRAKMGAWMLGYKFHRHSGTEYVRISVTVPYRTQYELESEELVISDVQTATYDIMVPKTWSYWAVEESGLYYPDKVAVTSDAFKEGTVLIDVASGGEDAVEVPSCEVVTYGEKEAHVFWPEYDAEGTPVFRITLTDEQYIVSKEVGTPPDVDAYLSIVCGNAAWEDARQATVKSDSYVFGGVEILSDAEQSDGNGAELSIEFLPSGTDTAEYTIYPQTYASGIELDELKPNGTYETTAVITYTGAADNVGTPATKEVVIKGVNALKIHTPVACDGKITEGVEETEEGYVLTLKEALNFFTLCIDNTGTHRMNLGYGTKDFTYALSGKSNLAEQDGTLLNQVQFPFDVYVDVGNDSRKADRTYDTEGDYRIRAGTWFSVGADAVLFYVPVTQENETYRILFRTVAANCPRGILETELWQQLSEDKVNKKMAHYVATDDIQLEIKSFVKDFVITDTNDGAAKKQLLAGNQALTLKKGYGFSYELLTQGEFFNEMAAVDIEPSFYWVSKDQRERKPAVLFGVDEFLGEQQRQCEPWEAVPLLEKQENYEVILQRWTGTGMLPANFLCVAAETEQEYQNILDYMAVQTITGKETFFKRDGYLVIHFEIKVKSNRGIWYLFEDWQDTELAKDALAMGWNYVSGDVIRYDLSKSIAEDYEIGGVE